MDSSLSRLRADRDGHAADGVPGQAAALPVRLDEYARPRGLMHAGLSFWCAFR
jgi:hypothetical protein